MNLTQEQSDIINAVPELLSGEVWVINSVAGSGKTFILEKIISTYSTTVNSNAIVAVAFNKHNAETLERRVNNRAYSCTFHSFIMSMLKRQNFNITLDKYSGYASAAAKVIVSRIRNVPFKYRTVDLINLAINRGYKLGGTDSMEEVYNVSNVSVPTNGTLETLLDYAEKHFDTMVTEPEVSFDTLLYKAIEYIEAGHLKIPPVNLLLVDEFQDLSWIMLRLIQLIQQHTGCAIVLVGDTHQGIYAFRGAGLDTELEIATMFSTFRSFHLSTSFRCPKVTEGLVHKYVPYFNCPDSAYPGIFEEITDFSKILLEKEVVILCRYNKEAIQIAIELATKGIALVVKSKDIATALRHKIETLSNNGIMPVTSFEATIQKEIAKEKRTNKNNYRAFCVQRDYLLTALSIYRYLKTANVSMEFFFTRFLDNKLANITISTIHGFKGLEAETVVIVNYSKMPESGTKYFEKTQEERALYVALTRAKKNIYTYNLKEGEENETDPPF